MGTSTSRPTAGGPGIVTVSHRGSGGARLVGCRPRSRCPPSPACRAPLMQPASLTGLFARPTQGSRRFMHATSTVCAEYAALARHAALPICEEQRAPPKKMSGVEALCARAVPVGAAVDGAELFGCDAASVWRATRAHARSARFGPTAVALGPESLEARATQLTLATSGASGIGSSSATSVLSVEEENALAAAGESLDGELESQLVRSAKNLSW